MPQVDFKKLTNNPTIKIFFIGFLLLVVNFVFSGYSVVSAYYVKNKNDLWLVTFYRVLIATPVSAMMAYAVEGKFCLWYKEWSSMVFFVILGLCSTALNPIMYLAVIEYTSASYVSILAQLIPIFSSIFSIVLRVEPLPSIKDKSTIMRLAGIVLGVGFATGVCAIPLIYTPPNTKPSSWIYGTIIGIVNNLTFSCYLVLQMKIFYKNSNSALQRKPFTVNFLCTFYGTLSYSIIFGIYFLIKKGKLLCDDKIAIPAFYSGLLNVAIGFGLLTFCIKHSSALISSCLFSIQIATSLVLLRLANFARLSTSQYILCPFLLLSGLMVVLSPLLGPKTPVPTNAGADIKEDN